MNSWSLFFLLALAGVAGLLLLRYVLPKIPLVSCYCRGGSSLWVAEVEDYGLSLTEDSPGKRLRAGRLQERLRKNRARVFSTSPSARAALGAHGLRPRSK